MIMNKEDLLVTIIIPTYNARSFVMDCYKSISNQTYKNLEIIFVNDCSTDDSLIVLNKIKRLDSRVKIINLEKNSGVSVARNIGLENSSGDIIGFCDADDIIIPTMISEMVKPIISEDVDFTCCGLSFAKADGSIIERKFDSMVEEFSIEEAIKYWLEGKKIGNSINTKFLKRSIWMNNSIRFPENEIFEESFVIPQLILKSKKIRHVGINGYRYIRRENSITTKPFSESKLIVYERERFIKNNVLKKFPNLKNEYYAFVARNNKDLYISAILSANIIERDLYERVKKEFDDIFSKAIFCRNLSFKDKIKIIELKFRLFEIRKNITGQLFK